MKNTLKGLFIAFNALLILLMAACTKGKENPVVHKPFLEFRDSMVGTYTCIKHLSGTFYHPDSNGGGTFFAGDTILGSVTVTVQKSTTSDSVVFINGAYFMYNSATASYWSPNSSSQGNQAFFYAQNDSLWFDSIYDAGMFSYAYYYTGHKR